MRLRVSVILALSAVCSLAYSQDLVYLSYNGPTSFVQYQQIDISLEVNNVGIVPIEHRILAHGYLSQDTILDNNDIGYLFGYAARMNANESMNLALDGTFSLAVPGVYNLIIELDFYNEIPETDEDNNLVVVKDITITQANIDWQWTTLEIDSSAYFPYPPYEPYPGETVIHSGEEILLNFEIVNAGTSSPGGLLRNSFYLSTDGTLDAADLLLSIKVASIDEMNPAANHSNSGGDIFIIPYVPPGTYFIIGETDIDNAFDETEESNNIMVSHEIEVSAADIDLEILEIYSAEWEGYLTCGYLISNNGTTGAGLYHLTFFVSEDTIADEHDSRFETDYYPGYSSTDYWYACPYLQPGNIWDGTFFDSMPSDPVPGDYYLIIEVTIGEYETNTANNIYVSPEPLIHVPSPEVLSLVSAQFKDSYDDLDTEFALDLAITNRGGNTSRGVTFDVAIVDSAGTIIQHTSLAPYVSLSSGDTITTSASLYLTSPLQFGTYTVSISSTDPAVISEPLEISLVINVPTFPISGTIIGEDGQVINHGKLFLYQKHDNGTVSFINKTLFTSSNDFSFNTDSHQHTLFYIPNPVSYPDYVPTILGKTVTLKDECFFSLTHPVDTILEVLKVVQMASGTKTISGNINVTSTAASSMIASSASQRIAALNEEAEGFPVVLLSPTGDPVRVTTSDADGNYEFTNLPDDIFDLVVALELDQPILPDPIAVDVTENSAVVDMLIGEGDVISEVLMTQTITFETLEPRKYGDATFSVSAFSSSGLTVTLTSSDPTIAEIVDGNVIIIRPGVVTITAYQDGNSEYNEATPIQRELVINKAEQSLTIEPIGNKTFGEMPSAIAVSSDSPLPIQFMSSDETVASVADGNLVINSAGEVIISAFQEGNEMYEPSDTITVHVIVARAAQTIVVDEMGNKTCGDADFQLAANATSGLPVTFSSSNANVIKIIDGVFTIVGGGEVTITASQEGNTNFEPAPVIQQTILVRRLGQSLTVDEIPEKIFGDEAFELQIHTSSLLPLVIESSNEAVATIEGSTIVIHAAGESEISVTLEGSNFFESATASRQLVVRKAEQQITFEELPEVSFGDDNFELNATASSVLPVIYESSNPNVAVLIAENIVMITGAGEATITAKQSGSSDFLSAEQSRTLTVRKADQEITFAELPDIVFGDDDIELVGNANSSLPVLFTSSNPEVAMVAGNMLHIEGAGEAIITATQEGSTNFHPAAPVSHTLKVKLVLDVEKTDDEVIAYPNPVSDYLILESNSSVQAATLRDSGGRIVNIISLQGNEIDIKGVAPGIYMLEVKTRTGVHMLKVVKK